MRTMITDWLFAAGETAECVTSAVPARLMHTWSVDEALQRHVGKGWYRAVLPAGLLADRGSCAPGLLERSRARDPAHRKATAKWTGSLWLHREAGRV